MSITITQEQAATIGRYTLELMHGNEWSGDTLQSVADMAAHLGIKLAEPGEDSVVVLAERIDTTPRRFRKGERPAAVIENWETEEIPTQEQMLRLLGLDYEDGADDEGNPSIFIPTQFIEKEG